MPKMRLVNIESPYAGNNKFDIQKNIEYARACIKDCLLRGEAPIASHLLYTQPGILDDNIPDERNLGIEAGLAWNEKAEVTIIYTDYGITPGMQKGIEDAFRNCRRIEFRRLYSAKDRLNKESVFKEHYNED